MQAKDGKGVARAVYVAPLQALATERLADWSERFGEGLGLKVVELTGEAQADHKLLGEVSLAPPFTATVKRGAEQLSSRN